MGVRILSLGDTVNSKFGPAKVEGITLVVQQGDKGERSGQPVRRIAWELVEQNWAVVDLSNGHWCYGDQVSPVVEREKAEAV